MASLILAAGCADQRPAPTAVSPTGADDALPRHASSAYAVVKLRENLGEEQLREFSQRHGVRILYQFADRNSVWIRVPNAAVARAIESDVQVASVALDTTSFQAVLPTNLVASTPPQGPAIGGSPSGGQVAAAMASAGGGGPGDYFGWGSLDSPEGHGFRRYHTQAYYGRGPINVAVLSTGVDCRHNDFRPAGITVSDGCWMYLPADFVDWEPGYSASSERNYWDANGTGTLFTTAMMARADTWTAGGSWPLIRVHPIRVADSTGVSRCSALQAALNYTRTMQSRVEVVVIAVNVPDTPTQRAQCAGALSEIQAMMPYMVVVVPAGDVSSNAGATQPVNLLGYAGGPSVLTVAGLRRDCAFVCRATQGASMSAGDSIDIAAASDSVTGDLPTHPAFTSWPCFYADGTRAYGCVYWFRNPGAGVAPAAAAAAFLLDNNQAFQNRGDLVVAAMKAYARPLCNEPTDRRKYGAGILDVRRILAQDAGPTNCEPPPPPPAALAATMYGPTDIPLKKSCSYSLGASGGTAPYIYRWHINWVENQVATGENYGTELYTKPWSFTLIGTVTDAVGAVVTVSKAIAVYSGAPVCNM